MADTSIEWLIKQAFGSSMGLQMPHMAPNTGINPGAPRITPAIPKLPATYTPGPSSPSPSVVGGFLQGTAKGFNNLANAGVGAAYNAAGTLAKLPAMAAQPLAHMSDRLGVTQNAVPAVNEFNNIMDNYRQTGKSDMLRPFVPSMYSQQPATQSYIQDLTQQMANRGQTTTANIANVADKVGRGATEIAMAYGAPGAVAGAAKTVAPYLPKIMQAPAWLNSAAQTVLPKITGTTAAEVVGQPMVNNIAGVRPSGAPVVPVSPSGMLGFATDKARSAGLLPGDNAQAVPESAITSTPNYEAIANFASTKPDEASKIATQAAGQIQEQLKTPDGANELKTVQATGKLSPEGQNAARTALTREGYDFDFAAETVKNMDGWEQLGLWGGLGVAGVGLLHALSGGGGVGSILMSLLGLGAAGFTAGRAGLLDQSTKSLADGVVNSLTGSGDTGGEAAGGGFKVPEMLHGATTKMLHGATTKAFDSLPDGAVVILMQQAAKMTPDIAAKLDQAAGVGGTWNKITSVIGSGQAQQQLQQTLGLSPQQSDRFLKLWAASRQ